MIKLFHYDVDNEAETLQAIRKLEAELIKCLDAHRYGIMIFNPDGDLLAANQQWQRIFQVSYNDLKEYNVLQDTVLHPKHIWHPIKGAFSGTPGKVEENYFSPVEWGKTGRSRWTEGHCIPLMSEEEQQERLQGAVLLINDITDVKQSQLEIERLRQLICDTHTMQMDLITRNGSEHSVRTHLDSSRPKGMPSPAQIRQVARTIPRREKEIFELLAAGSTVKEAAHTLDLAIKSVYTYRARLMSRLKLYSSVELAVAWREIQEPSESFSDDL